ncbi:MAG: hypothetical protein HAW61_02380, partial [Candidatus Portiera sp.]|nr:hypothetical protein [Portiera sp.]
IRLGGTGSFLVTRMVGGFVGRVEDVTITNSFSNTGTIKTDNYVAYGDNFGGFIGLSSGESMIDNSYAVNDIIQGGRTGYTPASGYETANRYGGIVGHITHDRYRIRSSYWDSKSVDFLEGHLPSLGSSINDIGNARTTSKLQSDIEFTGLYSNWADFWCSPETGDLVNQESQPDGYIRLWDLGQADEYPLLNCGPRSVAEQRVIERVLIANDYDRDGISKDDDVDDDGDGLIEIATASQLISMSRDLAGSSLAGSTTGCRKGLPTQVCDGYELVADIDLSGINWNPISACNEAGFVSLSSCNQFTGKFDGNGHSIKNMNIEAVAANARKSWGLFDYLVGAEIKNLNIENANIDLGLTAYRRAGILAGRISGGSIRNVHINGGSIRQSAGAAYLLERIEAGGMIGLCDSGATMEGVSARLSLIDVTGSNAGGLVGTCISSEIRGAFTQIGVINLRARIGVRPRETGVGGLAGSLGGEEMFVEGAYSHTHSLRSDILRYGARVGGLIGRAGDRQGIKNSYAVAKEIIVGPENDITYGGQWHVGGGGLIGVDSAVQNSYWDNKLVAYREPRRPWEPNIPLTPSASGSTSNYFRGFANHGT